MRALPRAAVACASLILIGSAGVTCSEGSSVIPTAPASAARSRAVTVNKPTIILVHGAWSDATGWQQVIARLQRDGYTVIGVQNALRSLAADVENTRRVIDAEPGPLVVVGHSYGGAIMTGAAAGNTRVKALVYLAAFAPEENEVLGGLAGRFGPSALNEALVPDAAGFLYIDRAAFHHVFAADVNATDARTMAATQTPLAASTFGQALSAVAWRSIPSWYLVSDDDRAIRPELQRFMADRIGARTSAIRASHVAFISEPAKIARFIGSAAEEFMK